MNGAPAIVRNLEDIADMFGTTYSVVYKAVKSGQLPARKLGRRIMVEVEDAKTWFRSLPAEGEA